MNAKANAAPWVFPILGAVVGGVVGYLGFFWIAGQGFYGLMLPGAGIGLGAGAVASHKSVTFGTLCGVAAILLGLLTEWRFAPFTADPSLSYFVCHLHHLQPITLIEVVVGGAFAFWLGMGRESARSAERGDGKTPG
jgi:hypothetical protein